MGGFLDKPITDKSVAIKNGNNLTACAVAMQGWRAGMEDAHILEPSLEKFKGCSYFAVFDGHGGEYCASFAEKHMIEVLNRHFHEYEKMEIKDIENAFQTAYLDLDEQLKNQEEIKKGDRSGCTAVSIFMSDQFICCANAGDSRAVMYSDNSVVPLSFDHKPFNDVEKKRITEAGGCVVMKRVNGDLAVSRAFGDFGLKNNTSLKAEEQQVTAFPEIITQQRTGKEQFIVIACDGIWDVIDNDNICKKIVEELECEPQLEDIGKNIIDYCLDQGSRDNMSIILIVFDGCHRPIPDRVENRRLEKLKKLQERKMEEETTMNNPDSFEEEKLNGLL